MSSDSSARRSRKQRNLRANETGDIVEVDPRCDGLTGFSCANATRCLSTAQNHHTFAFQHDHVDAGESWPLVKSAPYPVSKLQTVFAGALVGVTEHLFDGDIKCAVGSVSARNL